MNLEFNRMPIGLNKIQMLGSLLIFNKSLCYRKNDFVNKLFKNVQHTAQCTHVCALKRRFNLVRNQRFVSEILNNLLLL